MHQRVRLRFLLLGGLIGTLAWAGEPIRTVDLGTLLNAPQEVQLAHALKHNLQVRQASEQLENVRLATAIRLNALRADWENARSALEAAETQRDQNAKPNLLVEDVKKVQLALEKLTAKEQDLLAHLGTARAMPAMQLPTAVPARPAIPKAMATTLPAQLHASPKLEDRVELPLEQLLAMLQETAKTKIVFVYAQEELAQQSVRLPKLPESRTLFQLLQILEDTAGLRFYIRDYGLFVSQEERDGWPTLADLLRDVKPQPLPEKRP
jgi:hypothetical protein